MLQTSALFLFLGLFISTNCIDKIALNEGIIIINELIGMLKEVFMFCSKALTFLEALQKTAENLFITADLPDLDMKQECYLNHWYITSAVDTLS
jgi:hypothetical protein